jgi:hypothetical protein
MQSPFVGGSFAPPLDKKALDGYEKLAKGSKDKAVSTVMMDLIKMVRKFGETPASKLKGTPHPVGWGIQVIKLEEEEVKRIDDVVPWAHELAGLSNKDGTGLFDQLDTGTKEVPITEDDVVDTTEVSKRATPDGKRVFMKSVVVDPKAKALRDTAFHLLWYAWELTQDREPLTTDRI